MIEKRLSAIDVIHKGAPSNSVFISAAFVKLTMEGRIARKIAELDDVTLTAIARSAVSVEYAGLDEISWYWTP